MLKKISEDLNSIKTIQSKVKNTLIEIKNIYRETTVDEAENQINDLEYKEAKNNQLEQQQEKIIQKKKVRIA